MVFRFPNSYGEDGHEGGHGKPAVEAAVRNALANAYDIDATEITVSTLGSYVILSGFVRNYTDMERASDIAGDIVGEGLVRVRILRR